MPAPILRTENFVIRAFEKKDLEAFTEYRAQASVAKYQSWSSFTYQDAIQLFEGMDYSSFGAERQWYQLAIASQKSDELMGDLAVHFIDKDQIEVGFTVSPDHQRKSVASEALTCLLRYVFGELNKHRVIATTDAKNSAAHRLLEKLSFRREAHFVQNIFFKGAWGDEYQYALLQSEFKVS
ncbi:MAG: GNAT family protein [Planctomycetota bacterium]|nr:GNAT family protein [Planctomycetota bacterium]